MAETRNQIAGRAWACGELARLAEGRRSPMIKKAENPADWQANQARLLLHARGRGMGILMDLLLKEKARLEARVKKMGPPRPPGVPKGTRKVQKVYPPLGK